MVEEGNLWGIDKSEWALEGSKMYLHIQKVDIFLTTVLAYPKVLHNYFTCRIKYQPRGEGGTRSPPATLHCLQNPK